MRPHPSPVRPRARTSGAISRSTRWVTRSRFALTRRQELRSVGSATHRAGTLVALTQGHDNIAGRKGITATKLRPRAWEKRMKGGGSSRLTREGTNLSAQSASPASRTGGGAPEGPRPVERPWSAALCARRVSREEMMEDADPCQRLAT